MKEISNANPVTYAYLLQLLLSVVLGVVKQTECCTCQLETNLIFVVTAHCNLVFRTIVINGNHGDASKPP